MDRYPIVTLPKVGRERGKSSTGGTPIEGEPVEVFSVAFPVWQHSYEGNRILRQTADMCQELKLGYISDDGLIFTLNPDWSVVEDNYLYTREGREFYNSDYFYEKSFDIVESFADESSICTAAFAFKTPIIISSQKVDTNAKINLEDIYGIDEYRDGWHDIEITIKGGSVTAVSSKYRVLYKANDDSLAGFKTNTYQDVTFVFKMDDPSNDYHNACVSPVDFYDADSCIIRDSTANDKSMSILSFGIMNFYFREGITVIPNSLNLPYTGSNAKNNIITVDFSEAIFNDLGYSSAITDKHVFRKIIVADRNQYDKLFERYSNMSNYESLITIKNQ